MNLNEMKYFVSELEFFQKSLLSIILSPTEFASLVSGVVSLGQNLKVEIESLNMQGSLNVDFKISY